MIPLDRSLPLGCDRLSVLRQSVEDSADRFRCPLVIADIGPKLGGAARFLLGAAPQGSVVHQFVTGGRISNLFAERDTSPSPALVTHTGDLAQTLLGARGLTFHVAHIDLTGYEPLKLALEFFRTHLSGAGIMVVDNYAFGQPSHDVTRGVEEFRSSVPNFHFYIDPMTDQVRTIRIPDHGSDQF